MDLLYRGDLPQNLGDVFEPDQAGVAQIMTYIAQHPEDIEARDYAEERQWL